jgi:hypothetical protein
MGNVFQESSFIRSSWFRSFEGSILHGENKERENAKRPRNDEATLESCATRGPHIVQGFMLE